MNRTIARRPLSGRTFGAVLAVALCTPALVACGSPDESPERAEAPATTGVDPSTTSGPSTTMDPPTTTAVTTSSSDRSDDIVGTWTADAGQIIGANMANMANLPAGAMTPLCDGPITMAFADGRFNRSGSVVCSAGLNSLVEGTATIATTGTYSIEGDRLVVSDTANTGVMELAGTNVPFPDSWGNGSATYRIDGDVLEIIFSDASVGTVTQKYVRAG